MPRHADAIRVLIVDDEATIRLGLLDLLHSAGMDAIAAGDAEEALIHIAADPAITVLLTDLFMPGANGMELTAEMRRIRPDGIAVEAVVLTSAASVDLAIDAVRNRVFEFLRKPVRGRPLLSALRGAHEAAIVRRSAVRDRTETMVQLGAGSTEAKRAFLILVNDALRNPLGPIVGLGELMKGSAGQISSQDMALYGQVIRSTGQRVACIVEALTTVSALNSGIRTVQLVFADPAVILRDLLHRHGQAGVRTSLPSTQAGSAGIPVLTDPDILLIALEQILTDALQRQPEQGQLIRAGYAAEPGQAVFTITNPAHCMDVASMDELRRGLQANDPIAIVRHGGQGLSLILAGQLMEMLGGGVGLQSSQDEGTTIAISVPLGLDVPQSVARRPT